MRAVALLLSLLAPPRCAACGADAGWRSPLCPACRGWLARATPPALGLPPGLDDCWAAVPYEGPAVAVVAALKFRGLLRLARQAAGAIAAGAPPGLLDGALVPVPPSPARLRRRGFDPAELIAAELSLLTGLSVADCLRRADGPRQVGRPRTVRLANPPVVTAVAPAPAGAVLVDDVQTTGATLSACARALRGAGAHRVAAVTFARTPSGHPLAKRADRRRIDPRSSRGRAASEGS